MAVRVGERGEEGEEAGGVGGDGGRNGGCLRGRGHSGSGGEG